MEEKIRKSGIDILGDVPWGTHFCQFYQTKQDLIDILVPYFKAGLENNEFCMWITSEPLSAEEAEKSLSKVVKNLDNYIKRGQIEIIDFSQWYTKSGKFVADEVLRGWVNKENEAVKRGYDGLRLAGNTFWLEKRDWRNFADYEEKVNNVIGKYRMLAVCSYSLDKCGTSEVIDVVKSHQLALIRREGNWEIIESSERKWMEEALRESEEKYRILVENANEAIAVAQDGVLKFVNPKIMEITGYSRKELTSRPFGEFIHLDDQEMVMDRHLKRLKGDALPSVYPFRIVDKKGNIKWVEINTVLINWEGRPATLNFLSDITERKKAEEQLRKKEAFNFALFQYNPIETIIVDRQGKVVKANMAKRISGDRLPNIGDVMYKDYAGKHEIDMHAELAECLKSGKKKSFPELKYGDRFLSINIAPFPEGAIITSLDITERKNAEKELRSSKQELQNLAAHLQSIREKERMLVAREIHDELGQSLTALKMDLSWLYKKMPRDKALLPKRTKSMLGLVDTTIQSVKRISSELRPGLLDDLGLSAAIEWQGEEFQNHTRIRCEVNIEPEDIILDQERSIAIFRIFQEALTNIARHAKATRVKASLKKKGGKLELKVKDNGIGIAEEKISDPKSLGLIGIKERVHFLDGTVEIRGIRDKGTTITVRIPLPEKGKNDKNPHRG